VRPICTGERERCASGLYGGGGEMCVRFVRGGGVMEGVCGVRYARAVGKDARPIRTGERRARGGLGVRHEIDERVEVNLRSAPLRAAPAASRRRERAAPGEAHRADAPEPHASRPAIRTGSVARRGSGALGTRPAAARPGGWAILGPIASSMKACASSRLVFFPSLIRTSISSCASIAPDLPQRSARSARKSPQGSKRSERSEETPNVTTTKS
jgi:hypothetical protein